MKSRVDLLVLEVDDFIRTANLKKYFGDLKMDIVLEEGGLRIIYKKREYCFKLIEDNSEIYWSSKENKKIPYHMNQGLVYLLEQIITGL